MNASVEKSNIAWEKAQVETSVTGYYNGLPRSKGRIDVHKDIVEWIEGSAPFLDEYFSASFDG